LNIGANKQNVKKIIIESKIIEENANQILEFTKEVKNMEALANPGALDYFRDRPELSLD